MRNVEIKARASDWERQKTKAAEIAHSSTEVLQRDMFFKCAGGRLKLRVPSEGKPHLIFYQRADTPDPRSSDYEKADVDDADDTRKLLSAALGASGIVLKRRTVFLKGSTRIHFDEVERLGRFIEIEALVSPGESDETARKRVEEVMAQLGIRREDLLDRPYVELEF